MGLFKRKEAGPAIPPEVANLPWVKNPAKIDPELGDTVAHAYRSAMVKGDWRTAAGVLAGATYTGRRFAVDISWDDPAVPLETAQRWVAEAPDDGWGWAVLGDLQVEWAWHARGKGYAETVDASAWETFFERLQQAESTSMQAARMLPDEPFPWTSLMTSGRGLQIPLEEVSARFDQAHRRVAWEPSATSTMLQALCAKWQGSHETMFSFARMAAAEAPDGSPSISSLPMAYLELMVANARDTSLQEAAGVVKGFAVREELMEAANRSIFHPSFVADGPGLRGANTFLVAFYQGDHDRECHRTLQLLRGRYTQFPFAYFGDAGRMNRKCEILTERAMKLTL